jgi:hypothetical protein
MVIAFKSTRFDIAGNLDTKEVYLDQFLPRLFPAILSVLLRKPSTLFWGKTALELPGFRWVYWFPFFLCGHSSLSSRGLGPLIVLISLTVRPLSPRVSLLLSGFHSGRSLLCHVT